MDETLILLSFGALFSKRIRALISGQFIENAKKATLHFGEIIQAVAHDKDGDFTLDTVTLEKGVWKTRAEIQFDSKEARQAQNTLERQKLALDQKEHVDYPRVLMRFTRSDIGSAQVGKRSGSLPSLRVFKTRLCQLCMAHL